MNNIETIKLDNGLNVYLYEDKRRHSTFFSLITKFGGLNKDFKLDGKAYHINDGVAHILEHYLVEENKYGNFLDTLGSMQMNTNASTYNDMTRYYFDTVDNVSFGIESLLKAVYSPIFEESRLNKLKGPICQEIRGHMDNKFYHSRHMAFDALFNDIEFRDIAGTLDDVNNTTLDTVIACFNAFYNPTNQFIVVAGNFDKDEVLNTINNTYDELNLDNHELEIIKIDEKKNIVKERDTLYFPTSQDYREIDYKINVSKFNNYDYLKLDFYLAIFYRMFFGPTSSIYKKLVQDKTITGDLFARDTRLNNYIIMSIGSYSDNCDLLEKEIISHINKLDSFDEEIFDLEKNDSILRIILREENIIHVVMPFIFNVVQFDYPYLDSVEFIKDLNFKEFKEYIKSLDFSNYSVISIKDKEKD